MYGLKEYICYLLVNSLFSCKGGKKDSTITVFAMLNQFERNNRKEATDLFINCTSNKFPLCNKAVVQQCL